MIGPGCPTGVASDSFGSPSRASYVLQEPILLLQVKKNYWYFVAVCAPGSELFQVRFLKNKW